MTKEAPGNAGGLFCSVQVNEAYRLLTPLCS